MFCIFEINRSLDNTLGIPIKDIDNLTSLPLALHKNKTKGRNKQYLICLVFFFQYNNRASPTASQWRVSEVNSNWLEQKGFY